MSLSFFVTELGTLTFIFNISNSLHKKHPKKVDLFKIYYRAMTSNCPGNLLKIRKEAFSKLEDKKVEKKKKRITK